jgi:hypothetical protein
MKEPLKNARWERFAVAIALMGMSQSDAYCDAGYSKKHAGDAGARLSEKSLVASRINYLTTQRNAKHVLKHDISRERIMNELSSIAFDESAQRRDKLTALKMLSDMEGYAAPVKRAHVHAHMQVSEGTLAQLRAGFMELQGSAQATKMLEGADTPLGGGPRVPSVPLLDTDGPPPPPTGEDTGAPHSI